MEMIRENMNFSIRIRGVVLATVLLFSINCFAQEKNVYTLTCPDIKHNNLFFSAFSGKKIIVILFDAGITDTSSIKLLMMLDTLYKAQSTSLAVVGIPISDNGTMMHNEALNAFLTNVLQITYPITEVSKAKKANGNNQQVICKWLSNSRLNGHFNDDTQESGHVFVINSHGKLYASIRTKTKRLSSSELNDILNR